MASIEEWSSIEEENVSLDELSLSNEQGLYWNKIMSAVRRWFDYIDRRVRRLEGAYVHKGTVETYADLPATGQQIGDVYTVASLGGENYAWTEAGWQGLGNVNANLVHKDTDETIDGTKTFLEPIVGSVTGSAGSVDAFTTAQDVTLTGDVTGTASSTAGWTVPTALAASGVTAGTYGPDSDKSPAAQASFVVPCFTVDAKGRVTAAVERTITLPADSDTTYSAFQGATSLADGDAGLVPKPLAADVDKVLGAGGAWRYLSAADIASGTLDLARLPTMDAAHIPSLDASKIASGTIDVARLPAAALERLVIVADQTARFALTDADVQLGDTVKEQDTGLMFFVVDTDHLDGASGYEQYTVGAASSVPWSGVTGKPSTFPPESHAHGNLTTDGKLSTASRAVVTDGSKLVDVSSVTATELGYLSGVTSAVQSQLDAKAADSDAVKLTGDQEIQGNKTFLGTFKVSGSEMYLQSTGLDVATRPSSTINKFFRCIDKNGRAAEIIQFHHTSNSCSIRLMCRKYTDTTTSDTSLPSVAFENYNPSSGTAGLYFYPSSSSTNLGSSNSKWGQIYSTSSTISTSDARLKTKPEAVPDSVLDAWESVDFVQFKMLDSIERKGSENARLHSGLIAQNIEEAFKSRGLDAGAYGLFCWDEWEVRPEELDEEGSVVESARPAGDEYSLRYEEALCMEAACMRRRAERAEARIAALESRLAALEDRINGN